MQGIVDIVNYLKSSTPTVAVYRTRNPQSSDYYKCVEDHFETSLQVYEERFEKLYVFPIPIYIRSFTGIWTAATSTTALSALINAGYAR